MKRVKEGNTYKLVLDRSPELGSEETILRYQIAYLTAPFIPTSFPRFVWTMKICSRSATWPLGKINALFDVHIVRTNSLADPRFCANVTDFVPEKDRWPFTSTNKMPQFRLFANTVVPFGLGTPIPLYFTLETPKQELETTGQITLTYAYFAYKGVHYNENASVFMAQWHWDKAKAR